MYKKWIKVLVVSSTLLLMTACSTETEQRKESSIGKEFASLLKEERVTDENLYQHYINDLIAQYGELETDVRSFEEEESPLSESEKDELGRKAEYFLITLENFHQKAPATDIFKKSEKSLFQFLTIAEEMADEIVAISNTNGINSLGGVIGTLEKIERPKSIWESKRLEDLGYPAEILTEEEVSERDEAAKATKESEEAKPEANKE